MSKATNRKQATARSGKPWSGADIMRLTVMAQHQVPAERIARKLRRSESAVRAEAAKQHVLLAPPDRQKQLSVTSKKPYGGITHSAATARTRPRTVRPTAAASARPRGKKLSVPQDETLF